MNGQVAGRPQAVSGAVRPTPVTDSATPARPAAAGGAAPPPAVLPAVPYPPEGDGWETLNFIYTCFFSATAALAEAVAQLSELPEATARAIAEHVSGAYAVTAECGTRVANAMNVRLEAHAAGVPLVAGDAEPVAPAPEPADDPPASRRCWHCERRLGPWKELPERTANGQTFKVCRHCRASQYRDVANPLVRGR